MHQQFMTEHIPVSVPRQVPVGVVGKVHDRRCIGDGVVHDIERAVVSERVGDLDAQVAGVALLTICADVRELQGWAMGAYIRAPLPQPLIETLLAAMQRVRTVVLSKLVGVAI
jgi:hypothetical protein